MHTEAATCQRDDIQCQATASQYLTSLIGAAPDDLLWDHDYHLQGHAHCSGREIIVIAARDTLHHTVVLTPEDWNSIRQCHGSTSCDRGEMLRDCAIETRSRLLEVLAAA